MIILNKANIMDFKDKVVIVTGAGQGIGLEICKQLVLEGANVLLTNFWQKMP